MAVSLVVYSTNSDSRCVDKKLTTIEGFDESVRIIESGSMFNLELKLAYTPALRDNLHKVNYCYVHKFRRYYFVNDIDLNTDGSVTLHCTVDVLTSFKNDIRKIKCLVTRQENRHNYDIIDDKLIYNQKHKITTKVINGSPFSRTNVSDTSFCITITVNGG